MPLLRAILDGSAVNGNGVPYRRLGLPVDCALVTVRMLGIQPSHYGNSFRQKLLQGIRMRKTH